MPRSAIANNAAMIAAPRPSIIRAATRPNAPAAAISIGSNTWRNWGTPKSNSIWNTDRPMMMPPKPRYLIDLRKMPSLGLSSPIARWPSYSRSSAEIVENPAPPIIIRWVGPHSVTSWPKMRCQTSSSGKPVKAYRPQPAIRKPLTGAYQSLVIRTANGPGFSYGRTIAAQPATNSRNKPTRMK